eukprot:TRINITY_DN4464_c0_g1_i2.p1 TRINITY_DN4464_c0_g1~~TRINITY_DN4464_c0_g1_i2.p1  ORF type:complete len:218 (+),score=33.53 TRINITY_DN4464_c0_g1_i2:59-712(+)
MSWRLGDVAIFACILLVVVSTARRPRGASKEVVTASKWMRRMHPQGNGTATGTAIAENGDSDSITVDGVGFNPSQDHIILLGASDTCGSDATLPSVTVPSTVSSWAELSCNLDGSSDTRLVCGPVAAPASTTFQICICQPSGSNTCSSVSDYKLSAGPITFEENDPGTDTWVIVLYVVLAIIAVGLMALLARTCLTRDDPGSHGDALLTAPHDDSML